MVSDDQNKPNDNHIRLIFPDGAEVFFEPGIEDKLSKENAYLLRKAVIGSMDFGDMPGGEE